MFLYEDMSPIKLNGHGRLGAVVMESLYSDATSELTPDAAKAAVLLFSNRYPALTGSIRMVGGQLAVQPGLDPDAQAYSWLAMQQGSGSTVLDQLKTVTPGSIVLVSVTDLAKNLDGVPTDLPYVVARDKATAGLAMQMADSSGQRFRVLPSSAYSGAALTSTTSSESKTNPLIFPLVGGGIGFLVAGPVGALVGAGAGLVINYVQSKPA